MTALIFDTETHKLHGDIIEAGAMEVTFFELGKHRELYPSQFEYTKRFKPSEPISLAAMAVHHIVDEDLVKCPPFTKFKMPKDDVEYLIGHNIDYDIAAVNRAGITTCGIKAICTLAMARYLWPTLEAHNLTALAYFVGSDRKATRRGLRNAHSALKDCQTTLSLLMKIVKEKGIKSFEELYEFSEQARYPTHIFYGKYRGWAIKDLDDRDLHWILNKTEDDYLRISLENELLSRSNINENEELPFI
ncbi:3'-5' exonuclease [Acinetobacter baumannii]|nr:3'-5' exonuclease [Acinetobacter baumannii]